jgi:hypothetical protein
MRTLALAPAVLLVAGITCAPPAHALPILHWSGSPPTAGMVVQAPGNKGLFHADMNTENGVYHMIAANGCDESWQLQNAGASSTPDGTLHSFVDVSVNAGRGPGCQPTGTYPASLNLSHKGADYTMIVDETPFMAGPDGAASWILHGHDG